MELAKTVLRKLLYPPKGVRYLLPPAAFAALIFVFAGKKQESGLAYVAYAASAYALAVLIAAMPALFRRLRQRVLDSRAVQKLTGSRVGGRYLTDQWFRGSFSIYQGMAMNFLYALFRTVTGILYRSPWFISMAVYHFFLGGLRAYLAAAFRRREQNGLHYEYGCYRRTAWLLFLLNIPMGGMIWLMIRTNSGFSYPGYVIYLSALYTFYTMGLAIRNLVRYRKFGSPILSAAKVLNFVAAMMSILGLQTAMIAAFSPEAEGFRQQMNTITGACVYAGVLVIAVYMILRASRQRKRAAADE